MFKKFAILLTPLVLAPLGSFLTPSAAHAQTSYFRWTDWDNCRFNLASYTPVSVRIERRYSDLAGRAIQVQYGNRNSERITGLEVWASRTISGKRQDFPKRMFLTGEQVTYISPIFNPAEQFVSTLGTRYIYVRLTRRDNTKCTSQIPF